MQVSESSLRPVSAPLSNVLAPTLKEKDTIYCLSDSEGVYSCVCVCVCVCVINDINFLSACCVITVILHIFNT